jgi:hypothetical protein
MAKRRAKKTRKRAAPSATRRSPASRTVVGALVGLAAVAALAGVLWLRAGDRSAPSLPTDDPVAVAIERAAGFLTTRPLLMDAHWFAKQSAHLLGGEFVPWASRLTYKDQRLEYEAAGMSPAGVAAFMASADYPARTLRALPRPVGLTSRPTGTQMTREELDRTFTISVRGVESLGACKPENVDALVAEVSEPGTDYVLTHQLWALLLAHQNSCVFSPQQFEALRQTLAAEVLRELMADDRFTDLTAERMALLGLAGLSSWIPDAVIARAVETQNDDGSWPKVHVYGEHSYVSVVPEHQAALALYALAHVWLRSAGQDAAGAAGRPGGSESDPG